MPSDRRNLRFFCDESALGVGKALATARHDVIHVGHPLIRDQIPLGTLDDIWIPLVAQWGLIAVLRDRHIRTKPAELAAFREHGLRAFWIAGKKDLSTWGTLVRLVNRWDDIEHIVRDRGAGPWFMAINERDIVELGLPTDHAHVGTKGKPAERREPSPGQPTSDDEPEQITLALEEPGTSPASRPSAPVGAACSKPLTD